MAFKTNIYIILFLTSLTAGAQSLMIPVSIPFNKASEFRNGNSVIMNSHVQYKPIGTLSVTFAIKASGPLTNGSYSIPLNKFTVQITAISTGGSKGNAVTLSTYNQNLLNAIAVNFLTPIYLDLKYTALGGDAFLVPPGIYSTTLTFTAINTVVLPTVFTGTLSVVVGSAAEINLSPYAVLAFTSVQDYLKGIEINVANAINVFCSNSYSISVSASENLTNHGNVIPVNAVSVTPSISGNSTGITTTGINMSLSPQKIITSSIPTLSKTFNLKYNTQPKDLRFLNKPKGSYSSTLTYTITSP